MFETRDELVKNQNSIEKQRADRDHTWLTFKREAPLSNDQLATLRSESQRLGRPLTDAERKVLLGEPAPQQIEKIFCNP